MRYFFVFVSLLFLPACVSYTGLEPVYPDVGHPVYHVVDVGTLQPTLRWKPVVNATEGYDLVIFEGPETLFGYIDRGNLKRVYSREGIMKPEHTVEEPLKPGLVHFWSVKVHGTSPEWSRYNYNACFGIAYVRATDQLYRFKTPVQK